MVKVVYRLPLRALEGFPVSLLGLLGILLPVPSYTQICRRAVFLGQTLKRLSSKKNITDIVIDSSGLGNDEEARSIWKKLSGYHQRSLAETGMYRFKTIFGGELKARSLRRQRAEIHAKTIALNEMTKPGMPKGKWIN